MILFYIKFNKGDFIMARGVKKLSLDEQLNRITDEIENMEESLKEMRKVKNSLFWRKNKISLRMCIFFCNFAR